MGNEIRKAEGGRGTRPRQHDRMLEDVPERRWQLKRCEKER